MFGIKKSKKLETVKSAEVADAHDASGDHERWLATIWRNTALARGEFDVTYAAFLNRALAYLESTPSGGWPSSEYHDVRKKTLTLVNTALRIRQAHIIPRGIPSEDASRLSEVITFVVAVAVVLEQVYKYVGVLKFENDGPRWCPLLETMPKDAEVVGKQTMDPSYALVLMPKLVTEEGLRWLSQEPEALNELLMYFTRDSRSGIAPVLDMAYRKAPLESIPESSPETPRTPLRASEAPSTLDDAADPTRTAESRIEPIIDLPQANASETPLNGSGAPVSAVATPQQANGQPSHHKPAKGFVFLNWLRNQLDQGQIEANARDSAIHVLSDGTVFLLVPQAFERYAEEKEVSPKLVQNQLVRLKQHRIKKGGKDIFLGQLDGGRKKLPGLVLKDADVLWPNDRPATSTALWEVH